MKKFGFGKKDDDGDESNRSALFGSKKKSSSQANPSTNPYAQAPLDPYAQAKARAYGGGPPADAPQSGYNAGGSSGYGANNGYQRDDRSGGDNRYGGGQDNRYGGGKDNGDRYGAGSGSPARGGYGAGSGSPARGGYGASSGGPARGGYGPEKYGTQGGYGADKYGSTNAAPAPNSRYGAGGYGGLGGTDSYAAADDDNRNALFGGASERVQKQAPQASKPQPGSYGNGPPPAYDEGTPNGYGAPPAATYDRQQLTAEEEEEEDVTATKQEIRFMKQSDVSSTRNALRIAQRAEETGRDTLARLGVQGEHIHNTEKNLDLAQNQNRMAEAKAKELKTLNKSMFAVHVSNPFTAGSRREARDQEVIDKHLEQRDQREAVRKLDFNANQRLQKTFKELQPGADGYGKPRGKNLADRAKYQFEADSDDEEMENEIDGNLDLLGGVAGRLNQLARATGQEVDEQNKHLDRISEKGDRVDIGIAANRAKLDRFK